MIIKMLKDYYDMYGNMYKVLSFAGDRYLCQSYSNNSLVYFSSSDLFDSPPTKSSIKAEFVVKEEKYNNDNTITIPEFIDEEEKVDKILEIIDNTEEIKIPEMEEPVKDEKVIEQIQTEEEVKPVKKKSTKPKTKKTEEVQQDNIKETADDFYADLL